MRLIRYSYPSHRSPAAAAGFSRAPWSGLESELDRFFQSALGEFSPAPASQFPVNLYEDKDNTYVRAELPGVNREAINVEMVDDYLTITASRKAQRKAGEEGGQAEDAFTLSRSVSIPDEVQADKVAAAYENGVLTVTLPKREETKPKKITVAVQ